MLQQNPDWTLEIVIPKTDFKSYEVDKTEVSVEDMDDRVMFRIKATDVSLKLNL